jgi:hypothetical protein
MTDTNQVAALESRIGNKTERRVNALTLVRARRVTYRPATAEWVVSGEAVGGWDFRTFTELRTAAALTVGDPNNKGVSTVELSETGNGLLLRWLD